MIAITYTTEREVEFLDLKALERKKIKKEVLAYVILLNAEEICKHQVLDNGWKIYSIDRFNIALEDINGVKQPIKLPFIYDSEESKILWKLLFDIILTFKSFNELPNITNTLYYSFDDTEIEIIKNIFPTYNWDYIIDLKKYKSKMETHISNMNEDYKQIIDSLENNLQRLSNDNIKKDKQIRELEKTLACENEKISKIMSFDDQLKKSIQLKSSKEFFDLFDDFSKTWKKDNSTNKIVFDLIDEILYNT